MAAAEAIGATGINAGTRADYTDYYETVPASRLERMLWLESNQWASLPQRLPRSALPESAKSLLTSGVKGSIISPTPSRIRSFTASFFPPATLLPRRDRNGRRSDVGVSRRCPRVLSDLLHPGQRFLVVSGDFDSAQAKSWIAKYFGSLAPDRD